MATLKIDLGLKSFEVCDTDGNTLGTIRFNPSDPGLLPRWKDAEKRVRELASTPEGEYDTADGLAMLDREVKAQIASFGSVLPAGQQPCDLRGRQHGTRPRSAGC